MKPPGESDPAPGGSVAPRTGAWIETVSLQDIDSENTRRPPHGGVD